MTRLTKNMNLEPVITAAQSWIQNCLVGDGSVLSEKELWTPANVAEVRNAFVDHPDEGKDNFATKLKRQMAPTSPEAKRLMAEMVWALLLFPSNINTSTKRQQITEVWSWSGGHLPDQPMLSDSVLSGIGSGGPGFHNHRWREMVFLISLVEDLKKQFANERQNLFSDYDSFIDWITQVPQEGHRQFRHMLRFFSFPDRVERMSSNGDRRAVLEAFGIAPQRVSTSWTDQKLDEALLKLRKRLEDELPGEVLDFYESPLYEHWKRSNPLTDDGAAKTRQFWVEKTIVNGRPDRQAGENALGKSLWSPQLDSRGGKIYDAMTKVQPGDVVFHLVNNEAVDSFSIAESIADSSFVGVAGSEWEGRPAYRIALKGHEKIEPPINRSQFLQDPMYRELIDQILDESKGLAFNKNLNLNQGMYLTKAPLKLVQIWNDIHLRKTGKPIQESWNIPPLKKSEDSTPSVPIVLFDDKALDQSMEAIKATDFRIEKEFLSRFVSSLLAKPFIILTGNSGTGKTKLSELFVNWLTQNSEKACALVPVGSDWTDNRNVLGFVNHLRSTKIEEDGVEVELPLYQTTRILDLVLCAARAENERKPHFLILDEMNLSHVERYFADFLSALESKDRGLLLHREGRPLPCTAAGRFHVPETLMLPRNLFVIGTVNVDETTYMFSPKVLDRANVLEFRVGGEVTEEFLKASQSVGEIADSASGLAEGFLELSFRARGLRGSTLNLLADLDGASANAKNGLEKCRTTIRDLFAIMQKRHQEFAFRTMAEIQRFLAVDYELVPQDQNWNWQRAMDAQILQKILPKLHGSKRKIGSLLAALAKYCEQGRRADAETFLIEETKAEAFLVDDKRETSPLFGTSYIKLCEMIEVVRRDQFVSFIQ